MTATDTLITVATGSFHCLRYDLGKYVTYFVAPGVGVVKKVTGLTELRGSDGTLLGRWRTVYELASYVAPGR